MPSATDHPRACGEKVAYACITDVILGSPPRVRGKVRLSGACVAGAGITPARAGKSHRAGAGRAGPRDHPRACGEKMEKLA